MFGIVQSEWYVRKLVGLCHYTAERYKTKGKEIVNIKHKKTNLKKTHDL